MPSWETVESRLLGSSGGSSRRQDRLTTTGWGGPIIPVRTLRPPSEVRCATLIQQTGPADADGHRDRPRPCPADRGQSPPREAVGGGHGRGGRGLRGGGALRARARTPPLPGTDAPREGRRGRGAPRPLAAEGERTRAAPAGPRARPGRARGGADGREPGQPCRTGAGRRRPGLPDQRKVQRVAAGAKHPLRRPSPASAGGDAQPLARRRPHGAPQPSP